MIKSWMKKRLTIILFVLLVVCLGIITKFYFSNRALEHYANHQLIENIWSVKVYLTDSQKILDRVKDTHTFQDATDLSTLKLLYNKLSSSNENLNEITSDFKISVSKNHWFEGSVVSSRDKFNSLQNKYVQNNTLKLSDSDYSMMIDLQSLNKSLLEEFKGINIKHITLYGDNWKKVLENMDAKSETFYHKYE